MTFTPRPGAQHDLQGASERLTVCEAGHKSPPAQKAQTRRPQAVRPFDKTKERQQHPKMHARNDKVQKQLV